MPKTPSERTPDQFRDYIDLLTADGPLAVLDQSLAPNAAEYLFEFADKAGFGRCTRILDAGCADGSRTIKLAEMFGCEVDGVDHDETLLSKARKRTHGTIFQERVHFTYAPFERLPYKDGEFDAIWCREVVFHVKDLPAALAEARRVSSPGALLVIQTCVGTEFLDPREAERIYDELTLIGRNMQEPELLAMLDAAGWEVRERLVVGSEIKEFREESEGQVSRALMRLARLLRRWDDFTTEFGEDVCFRARAFYEWTVYQLLGKISQRFYLAERRLGRSSPALANLYHPGCTTDSLKDFPELFALVVRVMADFHLEGGRAQEAPTRHPGTRRWRAAMPVLTVTRRPGLPLYRCLPPLPPRMASPRCDRGACPPRWRAQSSVLPIGVATPKARGLSRQPLSRKACP